MKAAVGFVLLLIGSATADLAGECSMAGFYLELGCTPAADPVNMEYLAKLVPANKTKCPHAFDCPNLHPNASVCYYKGKPYEDKEMIPQVLISNPCSQGCRCQKVGGVPSFECAAVDCVETFDSDMGECVRTYDLESCCSTGTTCGKDAVAKLNICEVDNKTYREGESFKPKNSGKSCICSAKWNGSIDNPEYCRDINCGIEIHYQDQIMKECAPIFVDGICPIGFQCPTANMTVIEGLNVLGVSAKCSFGNLTLSVGDSVDFGDQCMRCYCDVPPIVSCAKLSPKQC
ncbi:uncharacterized protein LOC126370277 [Pectinophora gossypiella]|nr:uncharacterized protein LOC126370277 [Pectinophora gossypiella]